MMPPNSPVEAPPEPDPLARVSAHARGVVGAEGTLEWEPGLVEAVARGVWARHLSVYGPFNALPSFNEMVAVGDPTATELIEDALAALRAAHDWRAELDGRG